MVSSFPCLCRAAGARVLTLLLALPVAAFAQVPSFEQVAGHDFGQRITEHHQMVRYLERLAETSERVALIDQGRSWEGRRLLLAVVTSAANQQRLAAIRDGAQRLADPRTTGAEAAAALIETQPVIVWLGGSIHGFELSGSEGLLKLLAELSTSQDPQTLQMLEQTVVLIDPMLNPDGRDAFAQRNHQGLGRAPNPRPDDWGNDFNFWEALKFRSGHYFFDTNRDWFAHTQAETRQRVPTVLAWRPQVMVDAHEMGPDLEFFFDPPTEPVGPFYPGFASRWQEDFGRAFAATFDHAGFEYTTRDLFNYFYPGYSTAWGSYQGAVGLLFEQGSSRGLALERGDGTVRTLADALEQQYQAARTAVFNAAARRPQLLQEYYQAHREALAEGAAGIRRYLLSPEGGDPGLLAEAAALLRRNGIEVGTLTAAVELGGVLDRSGVAVGSRRFPPGTLVVEAAQPRGRLVRALLEPRVPLPEDFLKRARARVDRGEDPRFYDITAWSLPLLFDLAGFSTSDGRPLAVDARAEAEVAAGAALPPAGYAYLLDGRRTASLAAAWHLRERGFRVAVTGRATRVAGREVLAGSVVVRVRQEQPGLEAALAEVAARYGLPVEAVDTGWPDENLPALGAPETLRLRPVRIALVAEPPVSGYSFGWAWYTLDQRYQLPVTVLRAASLASRPLDDFDTLVLPDVSAAAALGQVLGEGGIGRLRRWVQDGGTLVAIGDAIDYLRRQELLHLRSWYKEPKEGAEAEAEPLPQRFTVPGAMLRTELDLESWLTAGYQQGEMPMLVTSDRIYLAPEGAPDAGRVAVARLPATAPLVLSGHVWPESLERLPGAVLLYLETVGQGRVIAFAEDPNFRGYWRGADRLFLNAVLLGPSAGP